MRTEVDIASIAARGDGVAETPKGPVFVPYTAPGDRVAIKARRDRDGVTRGEVEAVLAAGPDRIAPACPHFTRCGGCALQHLAEPAYLAWKRQRVIDALDRRGLTNVAVAPPIAVPRASRRRADLVARRVGKGVVLGFHARRRHQIVDVRQCPVLHPEILALLPHLRQLLTEVLPSGGRIGLPVLVADNGLDLAFEGELDLHLTHRELLAEFAGNIGLARLSHLPGGGQVPETIICFRDPVLRFGRFAVVPPPGAFLQAAIAAEAAMTRQMGEWLGPARQVADLFCGLGTFALSLADQRTVHGVDGNPELTAALTAAVNRSGGAGPVTVETRDLFRRPLTGEELARFDAVVFDPPRSGARDQAHALAGSPVPLVIAVSCEPATFARDAGILVEAGYRLDAVVPIDQFLWSPHVEILALFRKPSG